VEAIFRGDTESALLLLEVTKCAIAPINWLPRTHPTHALQAASAA
jgi:hypothetical protein